MLREPVHASPVTRPRILAGLPALRHSRRADARAARTVRHAAEARLARRVGEAVTLLSGAGIVATPLDVAQASAVLAGACNPDRLIAPTAALAAPDEVITMTGDAGADQHVTGWLSAVPLGEVGDHGDGPVEGRVDFGDIDNDLGQGADSGAGERWWHR